MRAIAGGPCAGRGAATGGEPGGVSEERLEQARRDTRLEAAPAVLAIVLANIALAAASAWQGWRIFTPGDWWTWVVLALPAVALATMFLLGLGRLGIDGEHRRKAAITLLALIGSANVVGIVLVLGSLLAGHKDLKGDQLLASAFVVVLVNVVTFGLVFWELDSGGPIQRALADSRERPDFQFPQDENPRLAAPDWAPRLNDYLYIAATNSIAFSPTDAMPLSHRAKLFMGIEATIAAITVLVVAARAVNILGA